MSWLSDYDITYIYKCSEGHVTHHVLPSKADAPPTHQCGDCFSLAQYAGFEPNKVEQKTVIEFDQNGRKAVVIRDGKGGVQYISKTKQHYIKTGEIKHHYTPAYEEHLRKTNQEQMLATDRNRRKAKVSMASEKDVLKNMPDGEYLSDGKRFFPAPKKG